MYVSYSAALEMSGLKLSSERRKDRCLDFAEKCSRHPRNKGCSHLTKQKAKSYTFVSKIDEYQIKVIFKN